MRRVVQRIRKAGRAMKCQEGQPREEEQIRVVARRSEITIIHKITEIKSGTDLLIEGTSKKAREKEKLAILF